MIEMDSAPPEHLVLGGGGTLGEAWMSAVLAGVAQAGGFDARRCGQWLGTSAGSIVAASLAADIDPAERLDLHAAHAAVEPDDGAARGALPRAVTSALAHGGAAAAPLASLALSSGARGGALLRRALLARVPAGERSHEALRRLVESEDVRFDGRLLISAVELASGRRVIFGAPGAPPCRVAEAVTASCAIPGVFAPVAIGARSYVDGGVWSPTNMDALAPARGARVLCLNPTSSLRPTPGRLGGVFGPLSRSRCAGEALALRHRGAVVRTVNPDAASAAAMGLNLMDHSRRPAVIEAGHAQGLALVRGLAARAA